MNEENVNWNHLVYSLSSYSVICFCCTFSVFERASKFALSHSGFHLWINTHRHKKKHSAPCKCRPGMNSWEAKHRHSHWCCSSGVTFVKVCVKHVILVVCTGKMLLSIYTAVFVDHWYNYVHKYLEKWQDFAPAHHHNWWSHQDVTKVLFKEVNKICH